jgi:hypothetical protein
VPKYESSSKATTRAYQIQYLSNEKVTFALGMFFDPIHFTKFNVDALIIGDQFDFIVVLAVNKLLSVSGSVSCPGSILICVGL